jgi:hypothetical protein
MNREALATGPIPTKADDPRVTGFKQELLGTRLLLASEDDRRGPC